MKMEPMTIRVTPDTLEDIDAFAFQHFPEPCPVCQGGGVSQQTGNPCGRCGGTGQVGKRAEALRFLLQFGLGAHANGDPTLRAMMAVYDNVAPALIVEVTHAAHRIEGDFRELFTSAIDEALTASQSPGGPRTTRTKGKARKKA